MILTITVDGTVVSFPDRDGQNLLDVLRDDAGVTGPKPGRGEGACGACTVLVGRRAVTACTTPAAQLAGPFTAKVEAGQGTRTALALLVAEELAMPPASVRLVMGQTDVSPFDPGTFGSRSMPCAAPPLRAAAAAARELLREAAAQRFGIPAAELTLAGGLVAGPDGAPSITFGDLLTGVRRVERVPAGGPVTRPAEWQPAGHEARAARCTTAHAAHVALEPRSALASWQDKQLTVRTGTSTPFRARRELAAALGIPEAAVHVLVPDFGGRHGSAVALEAARLARAAGRPVKVQWSRPEEFRCGYPRPAALIEVRSSADRTGAITGWSFCTINSGQAGILSPYRIPHQRIVYQPAESPLPQGPYRALAATANHFARRSHLDELAAGADADPPQYRLRHLDDERLAAVFLAAAGRLGWRPGARPAGLTLGGGAGIAGGIEKGGRVATAAQVSVDGDGMLTVLRLVTAFDCGAVVNPDNLRSQIGGAVMMGLGGALFEAVDFADGQILNASMTQYRVPRLSDLPSVEVLLLDQPGEPSAGGGETPIVAVAPAIANALFDACGARLRSMPLVPTGQVPGTGTGSPGQPGPTTARP